MPVPVILAAVAVATSVPLLWWSLTSGRTPGRSVVARNLGGGGVTDLRQALLTHSARDRAVRPLMRGLARRARRATPAALLAALERRITLAGRPPEWPLERVLAAKVLLGVAGALVGGLLFWQSRATGMLLLGVVVTVVAYLTPDLLLYSRGQQRQQMMQRELPDTLDQMCIAVEAGLGFESAMSRTARSGKGPLAQELVRTLQELQIGMSRARAYRNLADRTNVADVRHFVLAIIQAEAFGVPVADVLRTQAGEQRTKRRQRAEEAALKIPVKVIFPLILCILPTLFIVLLGPAAIRIAETLGSGL